MGLQKERQSHVSKVVDHRTLPKLPKDPYMMPNNGGVPLTKKNPWGKKEPSGVLNFNSGSRTKLTSAQSVLTRARREAKEIGQMSRLSKPTHQLSGRVGQVRKAPAGMSKEYQIAAQPALKILSHRHVQPSNGSGIRGPTLQEREARLKAAMSAGTKGYASGDVKETLVGSSDDDEGDDLFDELEEKPRPLPRPMSNARLQPRTSHSGPVSSSPPRPKQMPSSPAASSLNSRPRPVASSPVLNASSAAPSRATGSSSGPLKPMMARKRKEVDVFNRDQKRPKLR
jgi:elongin-A